MIQKIVKRDGKVVDFNPEKITFAVFQAAIAVGGRDKAMADSISREVVRQLEARSFEKSYPTVEEVQDLVEKCLIEEGHAKTAKAYILYRYEHSLKRAGQKSLAYSSDNVPYEKLWQALNWAFDHRCVTLDDLSQIIENKSYEKLIADSESFYQQEIQRAVNVLMNQLENLRAIIVAGPSSSGKTTTSLKIAAALKQKGYRLKTMAIDNYFFDLNTHPKDSDGDYDFETPQAIDLELLNSHFKDLLAGKSIKVPYYNFKKGCREGSAGEMNLGARDILLIDSLHGLHSDLTSAIAGDEKLKIYVETLAQLKNAKGRFVRWSDIRMMRRMVRDKQFRNYNPVQTLTHWHYVRRSELRYIISKLQSANIVLNTYLPYEVPLLVNRLRNYLAAFEKDLAEKPHHYDALERFERLKDLFAQVPVYTDENRVPKQSLLREFIGGSDLSY
ncbi:MAG: hypothetical protein JXR70_19030 [Spirochaetales bacterium]|nr:hypothetical protein [Spirochaetales bacterium]